ncbi:MAG: [citrate (pro-3S)-lyase] ligase [Firmicutes bacterium]|nr:[citrate (pro-3S)-lyase] ligase [Bacillota bacterium]
MSGPEKAESLIRQCGLTVTKNVDYTMGLFNDGILVATGSIKGDMLQMLAVSPEYQGHDFTAIVILHLVKYADENNITTLHLFTKPEKVEMFIPMGFRTVAVVWPYTALLEWGGPGIEEFCSKLREIAYPGAAALVMNCNPFTLGHRWIIERAASENDHVFVLTVEEDASMLPFVHRIRLIREGTADLSNVTVIPGGRYVVSLLTFPSYFTAEEDLAEAQSSIDAEIFVKHIAPALGVKKRYVGSEPFSTVTNIYNEVLIKRLKPVGIQVVKLDRFEVEGVPVSASRVRRLLSQGCLNKIKKLVPPTTWDYFNSAEMTERNRYFRCDV